jgi:outer membrane biosynthesis protein TonB
MTKTQADLDRAASALKEDGLPDGFNRLLLMTPEQFNAIKEAAMTSKIGPREQALRDQREALAKENARPARKPAERPAPAPAARQPAPEAPAPDKPKETTVKTTTIEKPAEKSAKKPAKKAPAPAARKAPAAPKATAKGKTAAAPQNAPANGSAAMPRTGSKNEIMLKMALRPEGATEQAICKKLGWQRCRVTLRRVCAKAGATLTSEGTGEDRVYKAVLPAVAA